MSSRVMRVSVLFRAVPFSCQERSVSCRVILGGCMFEPCHAMSCHLCAWPLPCLALISCRFHTPRRVVSFSFRVPCHHDSEPSLPLFYTHRRNSGSSLNSVSRPWKRHQVEAEFRVIGMRRVTNKQFLTEADILIIAVPMLGGFWRPWECFS